MKIYWMKGCPGSGKSTLAIKMVDDSKGKIKRINKDTLRAMLDNGKHSDANERFVEKARDIMIRLALSEGKDVIIDDTNLSPKHPSRFEAIAKEFGATTELIDMTNVPIEECIANDLKRPASVGKDVIMRMYYTMLQKSVGSPVHNTNLPDAYIFDVDGTLAHMNGRGPFQADKYDTDLVDLQVRDALFNAQNSGYKIIIVSGREGTPIGKTKTEAWLATNGITYDALHMRAAGDKRKDWIVKEEIVNEILKSCNILAVYDDRPQVIRQFRKMGLKVFDCGNGYEF